MNKVEFDLAGATLVALGSGALWWPERRLLCVSDLHLGKSERPARGGGSALPPYDAEDTLARFEAELARRAARLVICLGDSFDSLDAAETLPERIRLWLARLQAGRQWIWIEGNHDPGPVDLGGTHVAEFAVPPLTFRHIARADREAEVSGHYHPKAALRAGGRTITRPAFLADRRRVILPAYGTFTGGLRCTASPLARLLGPEAVAILTGSQMHHVPMPR